MHVLAGIGHRRTDNPHKVISRSARCSARIVLAWYLSDKPTYRPDEMEGDYQALASFPRWPSVYVAHVNAARNPKTGNAQ